MNYFRKPYLLCEPLAADGSDGGIILRQRGRELRLDIGGSMADAVATLSELRNPASALWRDFVGTGSEESDLGLRALILQLDQYGWIGESDTGGLTGSGDIVREIEAQAGRAANWLREAEAELGKAGPLSFRNLLNETASLSRNLWLERASGSRSLNSDRPSEPWNRTLWGEALLLLLRGWQRTSPLSLMTFARALDQVTADDEAPSIKVQLITGTEPVYDFAEVEKDIWSAMQLLVQCHTDPRRANYLDFIPDEDVSGPGITVLVHAEAAIERLMLRLGTSPILKSIRTGEAPQKIAANVYAHQYYMTIRYVEAVCSFVRYRVKEPLRQVSMQYLIEEIGHETYELKACRSLGISDEDVFACAPLSSFVAYPEILALLAETDPLAFCLSITVAEGLPGTAKPIAGELAEHDISGEELKAHQTVDELLDHSVFTRRFLSQFRWIDGKSAARAIERFLFIAEVSQMCWFELDKYVRAADVPIIPMAFSLNPAQAIRLYGSNYSPSSR